MTSRTTLSRARRAAPAAWPPSMAMPLKERHPVSIEDEEAEDMLHDEVRPP